MVTFCLCSMKPSFRCLTSLSNLAIFWFFSTSFFFSISYIIFEPSFSEELTTMLSFSCRFLEETVLISVLLTLLFDDTFFISTLFEAFLFLLSSCFCLFELSLFSALRAGF